MSRSYKLPIVKNSTPKSKQIANKKVRKTLKKMLTLSKGNWFKKIENQYNIYNWTCIPKDKQNIKKAKRK